MRFPVHALNADRLALYHYCPQQFKKKPCTALVIVLFFNTKSLLGAPVLRCFVLTLCIVLYQVSLAHADFYRWVDKDGKEFFTNDRKQIPKIYREHALKIKLDESRVSVEEKPATPGKTLVKSMTAKTKTAKTRGSCENVQKSAVGN